MKLMSEAQAQLLTTLRHGLNSILAIWGLLALLFTPGTMFAAPAPATNTVTAFGFSAYRINGVNNPTLTLMRGQTYRFNVNASGHPFWIKTAAITGTGNAYNSGVANNGVQNGTLTFTVPMNAPNTLFYICELHSPMVGTLTIIDAPLPPVVRIVSVEVKDSVVVTSTGATGWSPVPEYTTSWPAASWSAVAPFTNTFANGTNTTSFAPVTGTNVFIRIRNDPT